VPLETATLISQLNPSYPAATDLVQQADDHIRLIKSALQNTFPNINSPVTVTDETLNQGSPVGLIALWYGSSATVPAGWTLCNGVAVPRSDGTGNITPPNLVDQIVIGAGTVAAKGATAGSLSATATTAAGGSHTHTITGGDHTHTATVDGHTLTTAEIPAHYHYEFSSTTGAYNTLATNGEGTPVQATTGSSSGASYGMGSDTAGATLGRSSSVGGGNAHTHPATVATSSHTHTSSTAADHTHSVTVATLPPVMGLHYIMRI
jgi:hypothetical protein